MTTKKIIMVNQEPTILSGEDGFRGLLERYSALCLVNDAEQDIEDFASLVDGGTYTLGPPIPQQQQQVS